jgi:NADP-dependent 3-hydroxy acid dehydrogenase YdfG
MALKGLADRVAVVTGAAGGIGEGVARRLAEEGVSVVVVDIQGDKARAVAASLGETAIAVEADVSIDDGIQRPHLRRGHPRQPSRARRSSRRVSGPRLPRS